MKPIPNIASASAHIGNLAARHFELALRQTLGGPQVTKDTKHVRVVTGEPSPFGNLAVITDETDLVLSKQIAALLAGVPAPSVITFSNHPPATVAKELGNFGFADVGGMPAMAADIDSLATVSLADEFDWILVKSEASAKLWTEAFAVGYGIPYAVAVLFSPIRNGTYDPSDEHIQFWAISHNGKIVATSALLMAEGLAGLYCVSTLPDYRRKGLGGYATAQALREAKKTGYQVGVLQSSTEGHSLYNQLGFRDVGKVEMYLRLPPSDQRCSTTTSFA